MLSTLSFIAHSVSDIALSQGGSAQSWPTLAITITVLGVLAGIAFALTLPRLKTLGATVEHLQKELDELKASNRKAREEHRNAGKKLDQKRDDLSKQKKDLASLRKKNHAAQEEIKTLRQELKDQREAFEKSLHQKPAFADPEPKAKTKAPEPEKKVEAPAPTTGITVAEMEEQLATLTKETASLKEALKTAKKEGSENSQELKKIRRKLDNYRRIDKVGQSKTQALEDRLAHLGKQYYDAVSEIAVLKGEVPAPAASAAANASSGSDNSAADVASQSQTPKSDSSPNHESVSAAP